LPVGGVAGGWLIDGDGDAFGALPGGDAGGAGGELIGDGGEGGVAVVEGVGADEEDGGLDVGVGAAAVDGGGDEVGGEAVGDLVGVGDDLGAAPGDGA
jgi:hypothetical protein